MKKVIHLIAAARPNFMKIAPLFHALKKESWVDPRIIHTGQHYDVNMSDGFFTDLGLPEPYLHLGIGSGTHAQQTGHVMIAYEKVLLKERPDLVIVVGDVNSTIAATLAAAKLECPVAHLEAGLRSFDRSMPEEINRLVTDALSDILWTPSADANDNLLSEGIPELKVQLVGNIMIDSLEMLRHRIEGDDSANRLGCPPGEYGVVTLHRPANVDSADILETLCKALDRISNKMLLVFPVHPRTRKNLNSSGLFSVLESASHIMLLEPLSYIPFMNLVFNCRFAITDSGGLQEETTYLGIPCITVRPNTERPITVEQGTNRLCRPDHLFSAFEDVIEKNNQKVTAPELWDGKTAERVVQSVREYLKI
jgi:UDP-N-acetylglucosamine 2-epimerase (non-hydrolysing)